MRRVVVISITSLIMLLGAIGVLTLVAPESSPIRLLQGDTMGCLTDDAGACLVLPAVAGYSLADDLITLPADFAHPYTLVVMPFDQQQQESAEDWLAPFQTIADEYEALGYMNIAALPDLSPAVRTLVVGGLRFGVRDEALQERIILLFLEDQAVFLQALALSDDTNMQLFVVDEAGTIFWRGSGAYNSATASDLATFIMTLLG